LTSPDCQDNQGFPVLRVGRRHQYPGNCLLYPKKTWRVIGGEGKEGFTSDQVVNDPGEDLFFTGGPVLKNILA